MLSTLPTAALLAAPEVIRAAWIENLAPLVLLVFWIARQVFAAMAEQKEAERAKQQHAGAGQLDPDLDDPDLDGEPALAGRAAAEPQADLRSEVEDFLKRIGQPDENEPIAAEARGAGPDARGMAAPVVETHEPRRPIDPFEEPVRRRPPLRQREPKIEMILEAEEPRPATEEPAPARQRVELRHLPESQLAEQAAQLGGQVAQADDRLEARLHEKFDHRLGKLSQRSEAEQEVPPADHETGAARIKALLARPGGVREAVVLSEILRRPADSL